MGYFFEKLNLARPQPVFPFNLILDYSQTGYIRDDNRGAVIKRLEFEMAQKKVVFLGFIFSSSTQQWMLAIK